QSLETLPARILAIIECLQKIDQSVAVLSGAIPEMLIAAAPKIPSIATHDFFGRQHDPAIHRLKNIRGDLWEIGSRQASGLGFIDWLIFFAAGKSEKSAGDQSASDSDETESMASDWQFHEA